MPPWKPVTHGGPFVGERSLTDEEIAIAHALGRKPARLADPELKTYSANRRDQPSGSWARPIWS